ncbi:hypothetical protein A5662_01800 [Mycobacteriaceae bacterium 1482268.1]|nr:hypothetical protein A5662_01800 [Mycobacteriaceae bacterium 1482268.1]
MAMAIVLVAAGFAVVRVRGIFGSHQLPTYAGSMSDNSNKTDPKSLIYEVWGPPGATADINYIDDEGETNQVNDATLPWSHEIISNAPSVMGNIVAQGDSDYIGCRIISDGEVKDERSMNQVSAYIYCVVKSA